MLTVNIELDCGPATVVPPLFCSSYSVPPFPPDAVTLIIASWIQLSGVMSILSIVIAFGSFIVTVVLVTHKVVSSVTCIAYAPAPKELSVVGVEVTPVPVLAAPKDPPVT